MEETAREPALMASVFACILSMLFFASPAAHVKRTEVWVLALGHALCACGTVLVAMYAPRLT